MRNLTLQNIASACGGLYMGDDWYRHMEIKGAVTDSRQVEEGYLYIPIKGERVDGHDFIPSAFEKGALATLSEHFLPNCGHPYIWVRSSQEALRDLARYYRTQLEIPVIGITGSVGKTSTKEMIASVLSVRYRVLKTAGNFNNEIGLPLTILRIREEHEVAVIEMGISDFGEMHRLADIARPDVCVITNIGTCHLENLGDRDGVLRAKTEVFEHLAKDAAVILNGDDDKLITVKDAGGKKPLFYGLGKLCSGHAGNSSEIGDITADLCSAALDITMDQIENRGLYGTRACLHTPQGDIEVEIPIPGNHNLYNAMAAAGVGLHLGLTLEEIRQGIASAKTIGGRSNLIEANGILIVDDCYNANPMSMRASLDVLKTAEGRKIAVLGDMGELGKDERQLHYEVGAYAAKTGIDVLFCVGQLAEEIMRGAKEAGNDMQVFYYHSREELLPHLQQFVKKGDTVLVKASHFMEFSKVVEALKSR